MAISKLEKQFVEEFLTNGMNAKEAYLATDTKCKETSANRIGYQVLRRPHVREYIESRLEPIILSTNRVLANISHLAENAEFERDRLKALEMIGKFHKLFTDRTEITVDVTDLTDAELEALAKSNR